jgi:ketosteroid isomerase-like protein
MATDAGTVVREAYQLAEGNVLDVPGFISLFSADGVFNMAGGASYRGEHMGDPLVRLATMAPDIHRELLRFHVIGNVVAVELAIQGTFTGPFYWPGGVIQPNGGKLDVPCADFWYVENGKIKEFNCHASLDVMFRQVGGKTVFPSDGAASAVTTS